jgi:hypothetical protein
LLVKFALDPNLTPPDRLFKSILGHFPLAAQLQGVRLILSGKAPLSGMAHAKARVHYTGLWRRDHVPARHARADGKGVDHRRPSYWQSRS